MGGAKAKLVYLFCQGAGQSLDVGSDEDLKQRLLPSAEFHVQYLMAGKQQSKTPVPFLCIMLNPAVNARPKFHPNALSFLSKVLQYDMS